MATILNGDTEVVRVDELLDVNPANIRNKKLLTDLLADARSGKVSIPALEAALMHDNISQKKLAESGNTYGHLSDAYNALTLAAGILKLGGNLVENTTISKNGFDFTINGDGEVEVSTTSGNINLKNLTGTESRLTLSDSEFELALGALISIYANSSTLDVTAQKSKFSGQAHGGNNVQAFSASTTFDANNGNNQEMLVTASTTIDITNELPGTYIFTLEIDAITNPIITIGTSFGTAIDNNAALINADNDINIITLVVRPNATKYYTINTITA